MNEYRIDIKVRNNLIVQKIEDCGFPSILQFSEATKIGYGLLTKLINMQDSPIDSTGKYKQTVHKLCDYFGCLPEELFTQNQLDAVLETNKFTYQVKEAEMKFMLSQEREPILLEEMVAKDQLKKNMEQLLETITPREAKVIKMRFGLDGMDTHTLEEIAQTIGVNRERVRQIEAKAMRKLRHPSRSEVVREFLEDNDDDDKR